MARRDCMFWSVEFDPQPIHFKSCDKPKPQIIFRSWFWKTNEKKQDLMQQYPPLKDLVESQCKSIRNEDLQSWTEVDCQSQISPDLALTYLSRCKLLNLVPKQESGIKPINNVHKHLPESNESITTHPQQSRKTKTTTGTIENSPRH